MKSRRKFIKKTFWLRNTCIKFDSTSANFKQSIMNWF